MRSVDQALDEIFDRVAFIVHYSATTLTEAFDLDQDSTHRLTRSLAKIIREENRRTP